MDAIVRFALAVAPIGAVTDAVPASAQSSASQGRIRYDENIQIAVNRFADAVQARLELGHYDYEDAHGYRAPRVLGIGGVEPLVGGRLVVSGIATSGRYASVAGGPQRPVDLVWRCSSDNAGAVTGISIVDGPRTVGTGHEGQSNAYEGEDYFSYGYRRY